MSNVTKLNISHGDEDDDGYLPNDIIIKTLDNGWIVSIIYDEEGTEQSLVFPFDQGKEMLNFLSETLGI